jgi:hypothetical protein
MVITHNNPAGTTTNSVLELAAVVTGSALATSSSTNAYPNILIAMNNTPTCAWIKKCSTTSKSTSACILHHLAQLRCKQPFTVETCYNPGITNAIADCCSRLFYLSDTQFLSYMNATYPVQPSWTLVHLPNELLSSMNSTLLNKLPSLASMQAALPPLTEPGLFGKHSVGTCTAIPSLQHYAIPSPSYRSSPITIEPAPWHSSALSHSGRCPIRAVGQTFASLGCADPRLQASGKLDLRLSRLLSLYKKQDPPPTRVKPVPLPIVVHAAHLCYTANTPSSNTMSNF